MQTPPHPAIPNPLQNPRQPRATLGMRVQHPKHRTDLPRAHTGKTFLNAPNPAHKAHIPNSRSVLGSPLCVAAAYKNCEIVRILLEAGADVDFRDCEGRTALALVIGHARGIYLVARPAKILAMVSLLLEYGADVDARDKDGKTPLMRAVAKGNEAVVRMLLERGADVRVRDRFRVSVTDCVEVAGWNDWKDFRWDVDGDDLYDGERAAGGADDERRGRFIPDFECVEDDEDESLGPTRRAAERMLGLLREFESAALQTDG
ncbi:ankyrin repeat-containing domain protein [Aspergillus carlsbadensis]|nr:ankyrin repeat-containing domain protein [Aspergillus carlsbadensis]